MDVGLIISLLSLALSIFFWWNAKQQSDAASKTLRHTDADHWVAKRAEQSEHRPFEFTAGDDRKTDGSF